MKALLFDMDGTIVDNSYYHSKARTLLFQKYGVILPSDESNPVLRGKTKELLNHFLGPGLTFEQIKLLENEKQSIYRDIYKNHIHEVKGFTHLVRVAKQRGFAIALSTMGNNDNISFILDNLGVRNYFDTIIGGDRVKNGKPSPDIYQLTLASLGIEPEDAIAFEDTFEGAQAARKAGIHVIGVCTSHTPEEFYKWGIDVCVFDFEEYIEKYFL
jgi:HAD superfamily hydrolase (TIGR01509 family)